MVTVTRSLHGDTEEEAVYLPIPYSGRHRESFFILPIFIIRSHNTNPKLSHIPPSEIIEYLDKIEHSHASHSKKPHPKQHERPIYELDVSPSREPHYQAHGMATTSPKATPSLNSISHPTSPPTTPDISTPDAILTHVLTTLHHDLTLLTTLLISLRPHPTPKPAPKPRTPTQYISSLPTFLKPFLPTTNTSNDYTLPDLHLRCKAGWPDPKILKKDDGDDLASRLCSKHKDQKTFEISRVAEEEMRGKGNWEPFRCAGKGGGKKGGEQEVGEGSGGKAKGKAKGKK
ncbi:hypothetical protein B0J11DRAFT_584524 [Dendryphion nanum]|uniref:Uncharacterized protein n=1 Tax=Dendryphion nanum TaxID=256645 RepID=A0A9P9DA58_9PLEO|nr:hypothetical protein B0J11DRAFT_584524 [Dendryphion nanum]